MSSKRDIQLLLYASRVGCQPHVSSFLDKVEVK